MDLTQLLNSELGNNILEGIGKKAGTTKEETDSVVKEGIPVLLGMLQKNASSDEGKKSLENALNKHDGSILDNIQGFLGSDDNSDGNKILGHILGGKQNDIEKSISSSTGVNSSSVSKILGSLAPIIMGFLGKNNSNASGGIGDLLGGLMKGNGGSSILSSVLGGDGGGIGDILESVTGGSSKSSKKSGGLGGLLGGLFGKK